MLKAHMLTPPDSLEGPPSPAEERDASRVDDVPDRRSERSAEGRFARVRELLFLREAEARARRASDERRASIATSLAFVRQKREAAETLWRGGCRAEALARAVDAFESAARSSEMASVPDLAGVASMREVIARTKLPALEDSVGADHMTLFVQLVEAVDALERAILPLTLSPADIVIRRRWRVGVTAIAALAIVATLFLFVRPHTTMRTEVSAAYTLASTGDNAIDGKLSTEWLLPDKTLGWIDVYVHPVKSLHAVRLRNCHNRSYNDRGTKAFHVDAMRGGVVVATREGVLDPGDSPRWVSVEFGGEQVDVIRVTVDSYYQLGGGLAEINID